MNLHYRILFTLLFSIFFCSLLFAQWVRTGGPGGGSVGSIVSEKNLPGFSQSSNDQFIFASAKFGGVFRSGDDGKNWSPINNGILSVDQEELFLARDQFGKKYLFVTSNRGVFRTTNNGDLWEEAREGLPIGFFMKGSAVDYSSTGETTLYVGVSGRGVYYSTDFGDSWSQTTPLQYPYVNTLAVWTDTSGNKMIFAGTDGGGVYISLNGSAWVASNVGLTSNYIMDIKIEDNGVGDPVIYLCSGGGGVFRSNNLGVSWEPINSGLTELGAFSITISDTDLFVATFGGGVFRSSDSGASWFPVNNNLDDLYTISIETHDSLLLTGTWGGGIFASSDRGNSWAFYNNGLSASIVYALNASDSTLFAGIWGGRGVFRFDKETFNWTPAQSGLSNVKIRSLTSAPDELGVNHIFAGSYYSGIFHSSDNGVTWVSMNNGLARLDIPSFTSSPSGLGGSNFFAGTADGVFLSTNYGGNWISSSSGITNLYIKSMASYTDMYGNINILAGTYTGGIFLSTNNGTSWSAKNNGLTGYQINAIQIANDSQGNIIFFVGTNFGIFRSFNEGQNWERVVSGLTDLYVQSLAAIPTGNGGSNIVAGTLDDGVFISADYGSSWVEINDGLELGFKDILSLAVFDQYLFAGTFAGGVWARPLSEITSVDTEQYNLPSQYILFQNYPNPFNSSTKISWQSPVGSWQTIKVFDVLGREVATLVDEYRNAGYHEVEFNAAHLASGIYYYQFKAGSYIETKKIIYLK